ncbi:MAG: glycosyltransferase [Actinobacteria bacterium]|nr:glycosyltransferase [Actinomycetota bacterium]
MSSFVFATDARTASAGALVATANSLPKLGRRIVLTDDSEAEWVVFVAAGDRVTRDALHFAANADPDVDVLYGDTRHDVKREDRLPSFQRRPAFSPERLRSHNYIGETIVVRRRLVDAAGGLVVLTATDAHDRNLRLCERAKRIERIAEVFNVTPSANFLPAANPEAVTQHLSRVGIAADVEFDPQTPCVRVRRRLSRQPLVSVIIPTRGSSAELRGQTVPLVVNTVQTLLEKSTYQNLEFIVVADTPTPPEVRAELARLGGDRMMIVDYDQAFNFAVKNNIGVAHSSGEFVLLLNDDTEIISPDALETMLAFFADPTVGIVGPILHFEDGTIQSAGHIFSPDPTDMYRLQPADTRGAHNYVRVQREASSVIAACLLTSRKVFEEVGGLSTQFPGNWNDIDFALKVQQAGYRVIFTPHAKFFHFESKTRVALRIEAEVAKLGHRWGDILDDDPYFNPRLQRYINLWRSDFHTDRSYEEAMG